MRRTILPLMVAVAVHALGCSRGARPGPTASSHAVESPAPSAAAAAPSTAPLASEATTTPPAPSAGGSAVAAAPPPLTVAEVRASRSKGGEEITLRGFYVYGHSASTESSPHAVPPERDLTAMEISDTLARDVIAVCNYPRRPAAQVGDVVTVKGTLHGTLINPCAIVDVSRPNAALR